MVLRAFGNASRTPGGCFWHRISLPYRRRPFLVPSAFEGAGEGSAGDKFCVSGTQEMAEGAGANKESGVRVRSKLHPLRNFELHKKRGRPFVDLIDRLDVNCNYLCRRKLFRGNQRPKILVPGAVWG